MITRKDQKRKQQEDGKVAMMGPRPVLTKDEVLAIGERFAGYTTGRTATKTEQEIQDLVATCLAAMAERDNRYMADRDAAIARAEAAEKTLFDTSEELMAVSGMLAVADSEREDAEAKVRRYELALSTTSEVDPTKTQCVASVPGNAFDVIRADRDFWKKQAQDVTASAKAILGTGKLYPESLTSSAQRVVTDRDAAIARAEAAEAKVRQYELALSTTTEADPTKTVSVSSVPGNAFDVILADRDHWKEIAKMRLSEFIETRNNRATLREALEWYADGSRYSPYFDVEVAIDWDKGNRARAALAKVKP